MSEQVKKQDRQFLGANTLITAKDKCFKYKGYSGVRAIAQWGVGVENR